MADWERETRADYERKGFASRAGFGSRPALLIVDFINGFTDPTTPLGGDFDSEVAATARLLDLFREAQLPVAYTTVAYNHDLSDGGVFVRKVPSLGILLRGSPMTEVDRRLKPAVGETVVEKQYASAFFGTDLDSILRAQAVDTVVVTGCTTSGCVRASALDAMQYGYNSIVVREAVGDRAQGPHEANLFDLDAKYSDVLTLEETVSALRGLAAEGGAGAQAREAFGRWWRQGETASG